MNLMEAFRDELTKMGVSLSFIAKRIATGYTPEAHAAGAKAYEILGGQAKNRAELRDLVHERLRQRGRFSGKTNEIDTKLFMRVRSNPDLKAKFDAAIEEKHKMNARPAAAAAPPAQAAPAKAKKTSLNAGAMLVGAGAAGLGAMAMHESEKTSAIASAFDDELAKLSISRSMVDRAIGGRVLKALKGAIKKPAARAAGKAMSASERMYARFELGQAKAHFPKKAELIKEAPFKSQAQRRLFYALKGKGEMDQKTINEWESETPAKLPEHVKKTAGEKTSLEKATILKAVFNRAFQGKVTSKTTGGMAQRFLQTAKSMGSEPTREGLRGMISQVKATGTI